MIFLNHYFIAFAVALVSSLILTPIARISARKLNIYDHPHSDIKTHKSPVPYLGGLAIAGAFYISMLVVRLTTAFPTGTLRAMRGIFIAGFFILILGIIDDVKPKGLHYVEKFLFQIAAAVFLMSYGIRIEFIKPEWFSALITFVWIVGITNALNIIDVMDGLSSGTAVIAALSFFFIGLPSEEQVYVNFVSVGLAGALLGFLPYNLSRRLKIFMGDAGSLFIGLILSATALGTSYSNSNNLGVLAPILILAVPVFDTIFVMVVRYLKGKSPFLGSKDHFALRLRAVGCSDKGILLRVYLAGVILLFAAFVVSKAESEWVSVVVYAVFAVAIAALARYLYRIKI